MATKYLFTLYITHLVHSNIVIKNLDQIFYIKKQDEYRLEIIDVFKNPFKAEEERVLVIPTLIKKAPSPIIRFIGDLSDAENLLVYL